MIAGHRQSPSGGHIFIVALFAMIVGLSGLMSVPPLDRDESRFIQATTQMIETGDYVRIKYQDDERNKKPVGVYWLQAASVLTLADVEDRPLWAFRLPSLIGVMLAAIFTYAGGCRLFGRTAGMYAAMLLAAAPVLAGEGAIAKTDAPLLATVTGMQVALIYLLTARKGAKTGSAVLGFWLAVGVGVLLKGPIAPMIAVFTIGGILGWARMEGKDIWELFSRMKPLRGSLILSAMVLPWAIAIGIATEGRFFEQALGTDMLGKLSTGQEQHGAPFGFHLVALSLMFWSAALFIPSAVRHGISRWRKGAVLFCLAWIVPTWLVFELASTKLPHYTMVTYPAIAMLVGYWLAELPRTDYPWMRWIGIGLYTIVGIIAASGGILLAKLYSSDGVMVWHYLASGLLLVATFTAVIFAARDERKAAATVAALASGIFAWITFDGVLPTLDRLDLTPRLAEMLDEHEAHPLRDDTGPIALVGYHEPSAVFALGTNTRLLTSQEAAVWLLAAEKRAVVIEDRSFDAFKSALPSGRDVIAVASIEGFNYSNNKDMRLTLYRLR